ncbi:MAG: trehalose-phosphatase [Acidobacteriia bacterium]|nr:trehalose-phosphatase [Terriglobia bacterium]
MQDVMHSLSEFDRRIAGRTRLLIASDFDGALCPIANSPSTTQVPLATAELLQELTSFRQVTLALISGRSVDDLALRAPAPAILAGNNGLEIRGPGLDFQHPVAVRLRPELARARDRAVQAISRFRGAWIEDKGLTVSVHYRGAARADESAIAIAVRRAMAGFGIALGLRSGQKCLDIHPRCGWSKGDALQWIRRQLRAEDALCNCIGDDRTDEPMFFANQGGINLRVGWADRTAAGYYVTDSLQLAGVFAHLARALPRRLRVAAHAASTRESAPISLVQAAVE